MKRVNQIVRSLVKLWRCCLLLLQNLIFIQSWHIPVPREKALRLLSGGIQDEHLLTHICPCGVWINDRHPRIWRRSCSTDRSWWWDRLNRSHNLPALDYSILESTVDCTCLVLTQCNFARVNTSTKAIKKTAPIAIMTKITKLTFFQ